MAAGSRTRCETGRFCAVPSVSARRLKGTEVVEDVDSCVGLLSLDCGSRARRLNSEGTDPSEPRLLSRFACGSASPTGVVRELELAVGAVLVRVRPGRLALRCSGCCRSPLESSVFDVDACSPKRVGVEAGRFVSDSNLRLICTRPLSFPLLDTLFPGLSEPEFAIGDDRDFGGGLDAFCKMGCSKREENMVG